jgi:hypothetical protein
VPVSQNGYSANDISVTEVKRIPGTVRDVRLRKGATGYLLRHFAAWFDNNIETIDHDGELDDWGYAERPIVGGTELSNHASGTALDLNATQHPLGVRGTLTDDQAARIRRRLRLYEGCVGWGGDYVNRADEMHYEILRDIDACRAVAAKLKARDAAQATLTRLTNSVRLAAEATGYAPLRRKLREWLNRAPKI